MTTLDLAISRASHELGLPSEIVEKVYRAYWLALK
nr:MAG TPA: Jag N-terminus [Bacteriophage sp.]